MRVDGGRVKTNTRLEPGQAVRVPPLGPGEAKAPSTSVKGEESGEALRSGKGSASTGDRAAASPRAGGRQSDAEFLRSILLHEDDQVFVFNKPAGLAVQGGSGLTKHVDAMLEALTDRKGQKPRLVHRLDRDTSGVLVVARTRLAAQKLAEAFRQRSTKKIYWALVKGVPKPRQGRISTWLAREEAAERMRVARHGDPGAGPGWKAERLASPDLGDDGGNALGQIKFLFPNDPDIYLHDTPSKSLFARSYRAYSHGCVRVQNPMDFAGALLATNPNITEDSLKAMFGDKEKWVVLKKHIPVHLMYFTLRVDDDGTIRSYGDVYGHNKKLIQLLNA